MGIRYFYIDGELLNDSNRISSNNHEVIGLIDIHDPSGFLDSMWYTGRQCFGIRIGPLSQVLLQNKYVVVSDCRFATKHNFVYFQRLNHRSFY